VNAHDAKIACIVRLMALLTRRDKVPQSTWRCQVQKTKLRHKPDATAAVRARGTRKAFLLRVCVCLYSAKPLFNRLIHQHLPLGLDCKGCTMTYDDRLSTRWA